MLFARLNNCGASGTLLSTSSPIERAEPAGDEDMVERAEGKPRYTAFLSYSHKDSAAAGQLHRRLENYRLPKRLAGLQGALGPVPERLWPIFRDREELPAATDLSETVREALAQSGALIVLCSPHSAASLWVAEEIETFRKLHPDRPILAAVLEGDPPECFPPVLRAFGQDGTWHEPLATDLRPGRDGTHLGLLKLVAGITGVGLDALVQRDAQRKVRRVTAVTAVALAAVLIMATLTWFALDARREAERQRAEAEGLIEFMLTPLRERLKGVGRLDVLDAVNERALAYYGGQGQLSELPDESLVRRARVLLAIGADDLDRDEFQEALAAFQEAHRTTAEQLDRSRRDPQRIFAHSQSEFYVGRAHYVRRNFAAARLAWRRYKALAEQLTTLDPSNPDWLKEAAFAEGSLCTVDLEERRNVRRALRACEAALRWMERVYQQSPDNPANVVALANRQGWMVTAWDANGRWDRARFHHSQFERLVRSLIRADPANFDYREIWMQGQFAYAQLLASRGEHREARTRLTDAAATAAVLRTRDHANSNWRSWQRRIAEFIEEIEDD